MYVLKCLFVSDTLIIWEAQFWFKYPEACNLNKTNVLNVTFCAIKSV